MPPLVSVIIPAYNHEKYVQETIESIINQTYQNIELIIVDDGSQDSTWQKIQEKKEECKKRFTRIDFSTKENEGTCATLNILLSKVKGEYVYLIASDDLAKPQTIEKEVAFLENNHEYVLVVGDNEFINSSSEKIGWDETHSEAALSKAKYQTFGQALKKYNKNIDFNSSRFGLYETFVTRNYIPNGYLIRKSALDQTDGYTPNAPLEDWYMHLQLSKIGKYKYIDEILFSYRWHNNNTVKNKKHMQNIVYKTQLYEKQLVNSMEDKKWKTIFNQEYNQIKIKFNLCGIIKYYKLRNLEIRQKILEIFGHKFVIKNYKYERYE